MKKHRLSIFIFLGLILGIAVGYWANATSTPEEAKSMAAHFSVLADVFLRLVKMVIAPLVFTGIITGMANSGGTQELKRVGGKALLWFVCASVLSLGLGLVLSNFYGLGNGVSIPHPHGPAEIHADAFSMKSMVAKFVPQSVVAAMAQNEIMAILLFAAFFGFALASIRDKHPAATVLIDTLDMVFHVMLKIARYVMLFAPVGVFAAVAAATTLHGLGVLVVFGKFVAGVYSGFFLLGLILLAVGYLFLRKRVFELVATLKEPLLVGFSTASSEAALPKMLERLTAFGVPRKISTLVLPLAYTFNLDGAMMYQAFATIFLIQAYHIDVTVSQQISMLFIMLVASKGSAGVPRGALVILTAMLPTFGVPVEGVVLLLAVDIFVDMGRTVTSLFGNGIAIAALSAWEGKKVEVANAAEPSGSLAANRDLSDSIASAAHGKA